MFTQSFSDRFPDVHVLCMCVPGLDVLPAAVQDQLISRELVVFFFNVWFQRYITVYQT